MRPLLLLFLAFGLGACQPVASVEPAASATLARGQAFAQASCSGCHAIGRYGMSSNPNAPPFVAIANQRELNAATLTAWLRDAHNYPQEMSFQLGAGDVDALVAYMLTLRDPDYRPPV